MEPWGGQHRGTGVALAELLDRVGVKPNGRYVIFRGADRGTVDGHAETIAFERSLSVGDARESEALLAYAMNGEALPLQQVALVRNVDISIAVTRSFDSMAAVRNTQVNLMSGDRTSIPQSARLSRELRQWEKLVHR